MRSPRPAVLAACLIGGLATTSSAAGTLPSIPTSAYPYYQTLKQYTFDNGANPDAQGWTAHDLTVQQGTFWHVDDFAGLSPDYTPVSGKAMWCGVRPGVLSDPTILNAPGYGGGWNQVLETLPIATTPEDVQVALTCFIRWHMASGDHLDVEYRTTAGSWGLIQRITGPIQGGAFNPVWYGQVDPFPSTIQFRFVFVSDFKQSDEDGTNTNGAIIVDNLFAETAIRVILPQETFEFYPPGTTDTIDWKATSAPAFGNYGALVSGSTVIQSGTPNTTHVWSFFNGSTTTYACGGYPGQVAVPTSPMAGSRTPADYLWNEARSPWIDLSVDENTLAVDPNMGSLGLEFDVYADLNAASNGVRYTHRYRFMVDTVAQEWHMDPNYRFSNVAQWVHEDVGSLGGIPIPVGATHVQIGLVALDYAYATGATGMCHSPAPLFDNVVIHRMYTPVVVKNTFPEGPGSLLEAIIAANLNSDFNTILFDIPGDGPHTIDQSAQLPTISNPVWIDGFSQAGSFANAYEFPVNSAGIKIALDGTTFGSGDTGLWFGPGGHGVARGLAIGGFDVGIRAQTTSLIITGCHVGVDASGTVAAPNGIGIHAMTTMSIGGPFNQERMVVGASQTDGVRVETGDVIIMNAHVGFDALGFEMANGSTDIHVVGGTSCQIGQPHYSACGAPFGDRVRVGVAGIVVEPAASGVMISQAAMNYPYIDLGYDGITPNDPLDADAGANGLQNFPDITSADGTTIFGAMNGLPNQMHHVEFFALSPYETRYLGYQNVTTDGSGHADIAFACNPIPPATVLTATATAGLNTSELSPFVTSMNTPPGAPLVYLYDAQNVLRASVEFDAVLIAGNTFLTPVTPETPAGWNLGPTPQYWDISTTAAHGGLLHVTLHYDPNQVPGPENMLRLLHLEDGTWVDITSMVDHEGNRIGGTTTSFSPFVLAVPSGATGIDDARTPDDFALHANIPNPFNPATTIAYDVPRGGAHVRLDVFDVSGALVRTLVNEHRAPGRYTAQWNGDDARGSRAASGVYFYRMTAGSFSETRKMVLLK